jgi:AcrR family transcriptional regulator
VAPRNEEENQAIRDERREQILQAALKVFGHKGYASAKISDIAVTAGLSHGLVYHYFKSKDQIFTELVKTALEGSTGTFKTAFETPGSPWERLRMMTEMIVPAAYQDIGPYYFNIMFQAMISDAVPQEVRDLIIKNAPYYDYLVPLIMEGQKAGEIDDENPMQLATAYLSVIQGLAIMLLQTGDPASIPSSDIILRLLRKSDVAGQPRMDVNESPK